MSGILSCFENLTLTNDQHDAALQIEQFLGSEEPVFILKGYAGTGKTTLLSGICQYVDSLQRGVLMMAPTGRAAKVMAEKSKLPATTIHKSIYSFHNLDTVEAVSEEEEGEETFQFIYTLRNDADIVSQVFIIDEASMVSDAYSESEFFRFGSGQVLKDLLQFSKAGQTNVRTQLIFVGDPAQLPPVGMNDSPALDADYLVNTYNLTARVAELQQVVRQGEQSGILEVATRLRYCIMAKRFNHFAITPNNTDIQTLTWSEFMPAYQQAHASKIVICYKNKTAKDLSERIRADRFGPDAPSLKKGDLIVVGMNNFRLGVMNGTFGMIMEVKEQVIERKYSITRKSGPVAGVLRWLHVEVMFRGDDNQPFTVETWVLENFLLSDGSRLDSVENQALYVDFVIRYRTDKGQTKGITKTPEFKESLRNDPFFNALMVKYGYAVTGHKAQGSEWANVLVCFDYSKKPDNNPYEDEQSEKELTNKQFYQWAYTAITRSSGQLLALNPPRFSVFSKLSWIDTVLVNEFMASQGVETTTLAWTTEHDQWLDQLGAGQRAIPVQQKLIEFRHRLQSAGIQVQTITQKPYQEHLVLEQAGKTVRIVLHFGGKDNFKSHQVLSGDMQLSEAVARSLNQPLSITVERNVTILTESTSVAYTPASTQPQLAILWERVSQYAESRSISITDISPMQYRERYTFCRDEETAVLDFVYSDQGFFKEIRPLASQCRGQQLLTDLQQLIPFLKA
ncbi:MAG: AAA family ATPase [Rudanella sp.]|nr:AAA family ATPase [Rudanella sp.]